jgi:gluconolactonase
MKLSNYSLNYSDALRARKMEVFDFLVLCRSLELEGASLHVADLPSTDRDYLKRVRRAYLDSGLSVSMLTVSTDFGRSEAQQEDELAKAREAVRVAEFLGAPLVRVFPGSPPDEAGRKAAFARSASVMRRLCEEAAERGVPIGLQNHNHGALCRTGDEVLAYIAAVGHPNFTFVLDTGQFAGSKGASGAVPRELAGTDFMDSIRRTASLARHVRAKFYAPRPDGSEPAIEYREIMNILAGVHYGGFVDLVYEPAAPGAGSREDRATAIPRALAFLRRVLPPSPGAAQPQPAAPRSQAGSGAGRYASVGDGGLVEGAVKVETPVAFLEGPAVDRGGRVYFTNTDRSQILRWDPAARKLETFRDRTEGANGLRMDRQGRLVACEGNGGRVVRIDPRSGALEVLAEKFEGRPLGAPNDVEIDGRGRIYFTSRFTAPAAGDVHGVYRIDPDGRLTRILASPAIDMPNGLATSPDDRVFYLIDADGREGRARRIRAYDLRADGSVANERTLYDFYPGRSGDGMRVDAQGNLWVAAGLHRRRATAETLDTRPGIHVISPAGKLLAYVETPEDTITNCAFGGPDLRTLYITCGKLLLSLRTKVPGKASYRPDA